MKRQRQERGLPLNFEGMRHAPENELGVVFLFSKLAKRLGFIEIDEIKPGFPDCWAFRRTSSGVRRVWIEFEFRSRGFKSHLKQLRGLVPRKGVIICWDHNWPECDKYGEVLDLRSELGVGTQIWIQNTLPKYQAAIDSAPFRKKPYEVWTVSPSARPGDILLMYRAGSNTEAKKYDVDSDLLQSIANVFMVKSKPRREPRWGYQSEVIQIASLRYPLRLEQIRRDRILQHTPFVRRSMLGRTNVTSYWHRIFDLIVKLNPDRQTHKRLAPFAPEKL